MRQDRGPTHWPSGGIDVGSEHCVNETLIGASVWGLPAVIREKAEVTAPNFVREDQPREEGQLADMRPRFDAS